ncbi:hypothetical protein [Corynebacterium gerontici]|uniref:Uncharacterized protein n=1 Tax=Corynebacterium gerontici TaxID=2079234 RepID=A0A3G6IZZ6_9CORY|nr:hypothetical protein [Corynebacterium gerontici]AZA11093.1 hypothetical protein CGERO_03880 [Corynebacterium gerontici]
MSHNTADVLRFLYNFADPAGRSADLGACIDNLKAINGESLYRALPAKTRRTLDSGSYFKSVGDVLDEVLDLFDLKEVITYLEELEDLLERFDNAMQLELSSNGGSPNDTSYSNGIPIWLGGEEVADEDYIPTVTILMHYTGTTPPKFEGA